MIPNIANVDLSPLVLLLVLQIVLMVLAGYAATTASASAVRGLIFRTGFKRKGAMTGGSCRRQTGGRLPDRAQPSNITCPSTSV